MHILIAGGAGFVGSNLALLFKEHYPDYRITCLDNLSRNGSALNLPRLKQAGIEFQHADTRFASDLYSQHPIDLIIDAAAEPSVLAGISQNPDYLVQTNFNGTVHLLNLARQHHAGFIFLSTSRVYPIARLCEINLGESDTRFTIAGEQSLPGITVDGINEDFPLEGSRSLYGATKLASELMVQEYAAFFGIETVINRCGVIAGPWQMGKVDQGVVVLWMARHFWQLPLQYIGFGGSGRQVRDLLHIHDMYRLVDYQAHNISQQKGSCFNVGGGLSSSASLSELTALCSQITGKATSITASNTDRPGDIPLYVTDNSRVTAATGWRPRYTSADILSHIHDWLLQEEAILAPVLKN